MKSAVHVTHHTLPNGLTVLVHPLHTVPQVSIQLWYHVGSKDETTGQKGIAHLIEHMIFKGTSRLSESDINLITHKLSGTCNAFTSHDYTGYLFNFPTQHWGAALDMLSDCMHNCTFKADLLMSEMKAVVQELKMYRDSYGRDLAEQMLSTIFQDHPYHYPIIGFKQDLWSLKRDALVAFYQHHYVPNNATLVVVGDVTQQEVMHKAQQAFGHLAGQPAYTKQEFYHGFDIKRTTTTLYRDVQQPIMMAAYVIPGARQGLDYIYDVLGYVMANGKSSRLHQKLVDQLQIATRVELFTYDLFDYGLVYISVQPKAPRDVETIFSVIQEEMHKVQEGFLPDEIQRATKQAQARYLSLLENHEEQAYVIGKSFLATGNPHFLSTYMDHEPAGIQQAIKEMGQRYFSASLMHTGVVLPLASQDKKLWRLCQEQSDAEDTKILSGIIRQTEIEDGVQVHTVQVQPAPHFAFPRAVKRQLSNGLTVLHYHNPAVAKIDLILELEAKHYYDPADKQGLSTCLYRMLLEGTAEYPGATFMQEVESLGMSIEVRPGYISMSMLSVDFQKGLELLQQVLMHATLLESSLQKIKEQVIADLRAYWDNPASFVAQLARQEIYANHPYSALSLGTFEGIAAVALEDITAAYTRFFVPDQARLSLAGDVSAYKVPEMIESVLGSWSGKAMTPPVFPSLSLPAEHTVVRSLDRDQVVLGFAGLSLQRFDPDYDALLIFDQIFTGGSSGTMSSRLFDLREQSGLFYTISGSLVAYADEQPGMLFIKTIVSMDRLQEAQKLIKKCIKEAANDIRPEDLEQAKNAIVHHMIDLFSSNAHIAATLLTADRFNFPADYFDTRAQTLAAITHADVERALARVMQLDHLVTLHIGRF